MEGGKNNSILSNICFLRSRWTKR